MIFRELIRQHPFIRLLLPFVCGILLANFLSFPSEFGWGSMFLGFIGIVVFVFNSTLRKSYAFRTLFGFFVFAFFLGFGSQRYSGTESDMLISNSDTVVFFIGKVMENPVEKDNSMSSVFFINKIKRAERWTNESAKLMLYLQKSREAKRLQPGDQMILKAHLQRVKNSGNPYEFNYAAYLKTQHILYSVYVDSLSWRSLDSEPQFSLEILAQNWRNHLLSIYKQNGIKGDSFDILAALTLGYKTGIDPEVKQAWINAGAMHVLAVSGLHVGIIYLVMNFMLGFFMRFKWGRWIRGVVLIFTLWMYALLTGMSPSVTRAATMFCFIVLGEMMNRQGSIYNSLAASAFFLLMVDPFLLFTVGFQFSYLAVASIVFFQPRLDKLIYVKNPLLNKIWQLTTVGIAAQIGTFPLSIYYFHQFPTYFLLSGYLVISMAGFLIYLSVILLLFSPISSISSVLGWLLHKSVQVLNNTIVRIQKLPGSVIEDIPMDAYQLFLLYLLLFCLIFIFSLKRKNAIFTFLILLIALQIPTVIDRFQEPEKGFVVFHSRKHSLMGFFEGEKMKILSDSLILDANKDRILKPYLLNRRIKNVEFAILKDLEIKAIGNSIVAIVGNGSVKNIEIIDSIHPDFIIFRSESLKSKFIGKIDFTTTNVVLDASVNSQKRKDIFLTSNVEAFNVYDIQVDGAFVRDVSSEN